MILFAEFIDQRPAILSPGEIQVDRVVLESGALRLQLRAGGGEPVILTSEDAARLAGMLLAEAFPPALPS